MVKRRVVAAKRPSRQKPKPKRKETKTMATHLNETHEKKPTPAAAPAAGVTVTWLGPPDEKVWQGHPFVKDKPVPASDLPPEVVEAARNYPARFKVG